MLIPFYAVEKYFAFRESLSTNFIDRDSLKLSNLLKLNYSFLHTDC